MGPTTFYVEAFLRRGYAKFECGTSFVNMSRGTYRCFIQDFLQGCSPFNFELHRYTRNELWDHISKGTDFEFARSRAKDQQSRSHMSTHFGPGGKLPTVSCRRPSVFLRVRRPPSCCQVLLFESAALGRYVFCIVWGNVR